MRRTNFVFYAPNKYFFLPPDEKNALFWQVSFYLSTQKNTLDDTA